MILLHEILSDFKAIKIGKSLLKLHHTLYFHKLNLMTNVCLDL